MLLLYHFHSGHIAPGLFGTLDFTPIIHFPEFVKFLILKQNRYNVCVFKKHKDDKSTINSIQADFL